MCGVETPNPILEQTRGFVVFSTCQSCRDSLMGRFGRNKRNQSTIRKQAVTPTKVEVTRDPVKPSRPMKESLGSFLEVLF